MLPAVQDATGNLFGGERKHVMIAPRAVDVNKPLLQPLEPEAQFFHHSQRRFVFGADVDFYSVESNVFEKVVGNQGNSSGRDTFTGYLRRHPIANARARNRTEEHVRNIELPNDFTTHLNYKRHRLVLFERFQQPSNHCLDVEGGGAVGRCGFPGPQPRPIAEDQGLQPLHIAHANDAQSCLTVRERKVKGHDGKISRMSNNSTHDSKAMLRKTVRDGRRNGFDCGESHSIRLIELVVRNRFTKVAAYEEFDNEPSLAGFREWCSLNGVEVLLPEIVNETGLAWAAHGIAGELHDAELIVMPALAAGLDGNRLGRGKGYYDRAVANVVAPRVVVVHDSELFETVPAEEFDQKVSMVVTCSEAVDLDGRLN